MIALADLEQRLNHPEQATAWLAKAISTNPQAVAPRLTLVNLMLVQRDNAKALAAARELRQLFPDNPNAIEAMGRAQILSGDAAGAADTYRALVSAAPTVPNHERLAQVLIAGGDPAGAKTALRNGTKANPEAASLVSELTSLMQRTGEGEEALKVAKEWQAKNPKSIAGDLIVANILALQGNYKDAASAAEQAYSKEQSSVTAIALAKTRLALGDGAGAATGLQEFLKGSPKDSQARELLASVHISARQYDRAIVESEEVLKVQPANPVVLNNLAWLYSLKSDSRALEYAERAHAIAPNAPAITDTLGYILVRKGDVERGLPLLKQAYDASKNAPEIGYHLAVALEKSGQAAEARAVLEAVLNDPAAFEDKAEARKLFESIPAR
jgi:putative PEP-CTERM system TPR-repeat lipoprotein